LKTGLKYNLRRERVKTIDLQIIRPGQCFTKKGRKLFITLKLEGISVAATFFDHSQDKSGC
jgi:hypothetical protein